MAKVLKEKLNKLVLLVVMVVLLISSNIGVSGGVFAAAETEGTSGIMQELATLTVNGKEFAAADYPANAEGKPQLLYLHEYGYGFTAEMRSAYGLVLYIYNPAQLDIKEDVRNTVQMKFGYAMRYTKYNLSVIEGSADKLFFKLGVSFKGDERSAALAALDKDSRVYEVSSIELYVEGFNATDFSVSRTFTYSGYAAGYGADEEGTLTLSYTVKSAPQPPIPIKVHHTSWRPEGTNGNSEYTQDTIHSVYFAVPKKYAEEYDYLKSVKAQWLKARLAPVLVTDDKEAYDALIDLQKKNAELSTEAPEKFALSGSGWNYNWGFGFNRGMNETHVYFDKQFGFHGENPYRSYLLLRNIDKRNALPAIYLPVYTGGTSASEYVVTSSELTEMVQNEANNGLFNNDKKVAGKYPSYLFESYDEDFTVEIITKGEFDKTLNLHSEEVKRTFWENLIGKHHAENVQDYEKLEAIKEVTDSDNVERKSPQEISDSLYISPRDAEEFKKFYEDNSEKSTIYLLRFAISEYWRGETEIYKENKYSGVWAYDYRSNSGGYLAQTDCFLDFDIIDFEYAKEDKSYVIPVSMSPIDIFPELTPPPKSYDFTWYAVVTIAGLITFYVVYKVTGKAVTA